MIEDFNQPTDKFDSLPEVLRLHGRRHFTRRGPIMSKVVCVLYDDPVAACQRPMRATSLPHIERYPGGQTAPTPKQIDFKPSELPGCVSGELGLRKYLESQGHKLVVTSDKDGPNSVFERELPDAEIVGSRRT
jgi:formate dehydrogenase